MRWEYIKVGLSNADPEGHLNRLGAEGWELISFEHGLAYLKRPKASGNIDRAAEDIVRTSGRSKSK